MKYGKWMLAALGASLLAEAALAQIVPPPAGYEHDPYYWLSDIRGDKALAWAYHTYA